MKAAPKIMSSRWLHHFLLTVPPSHSRFVMFVTLVAVLAVGAAPAQVAPKATTRRRSPSTTPQAAPKLLTSRLATLSQARATGDPEKIVASSRALVAEALRELGVLQMLQAEWASASELFKNSLDIEESPTTRMDLAISFLRLRKPGDAVYEAQKVVFSYPQNARAWHVSGEGYFLQRDWPNAITSLKKSVAITPDLNALYSLGSAYLMQKDKDHAAEAFKKIIDQGESAALHVLFGDAYGEAGFRSEALNEYKKAVALDSQLPHVHFFAALGQLMHDEWAPSEEAVRELREEVRQFPDGYFGNYYLGALLSGFNQIEESNKHLQIATIAKPKWPEPWLFLGLNAASQENDEKAREYLRKAIRFTGNDESRNNFQITRAYIALGRIENARGNKAEGARLMARARELTGLRLNNSKQSIASMAAQSGMGGGAAVMPVQVPEEDKQEMRRSTEDRDVAEPTDASVRATSRLTQTQLEAVKKRAKQLRTILASGYNDWGTAQARQQDYKQAYQYFLEAEKWDPGSPDVQRNVGLAAFRVGDYKEAARVFKSETERHPDPKIQSMLAASLFSTAQFTEATAAFSKLGDSVYADPRLAYGYAFSLAATKKNQEATVVLNRLSAQPLAPEMLIQVGQVYGDVGDNEHALACFKKAVSMDSKLSAAHYNAGLVLIRMDRLAEAAKELEQAYKVNPADTNTRYNLAFALLKTEQKSRGIELLRGLIQENPDHALAQYQLGKELLDDGELSEAVEHLERAAALDQNRDFIHFQLQAAYRKQGRTQDAERELKLYRELKARNRQQTLPMPGDSRPE